ncbi:MAG: tripartite tricarboxylate transporter substrate binding protein [Pseudomonadota bacterium]
MRLVRNALVALAALAAVSNAAPASAQLPNYPTRTITLVVPFAAGGPTDIIARIISNALAQALNANVIVDNRAGGGGNIGITYVARSAPDGHTLLLTSTAIAVNPALFENLPYDPFKDFVPISELVNAPNVIYVRPDSGIASIADLVAKAKAEPEKFNYSSPGVGTKSHLSGELLKLRAGINMQHVPYRGGGPSVQAVVAGTVQVGSVALAPVEPLIKSGTIKALAVTGANRWWSLPEIPTMIESGYPGFVSDTFNALFAPAGTPKEIVDLLVKEARAAMQKPEAREAARRAGYEIVGGTPEQMTARLVAEIAGVKELVAKAGIKPEN